MSHLQNKSDMSAAVAKLAHDNGYFSAVAHGAYYSCYQLLKHIWLHSMGKTEAELKAGIDDSKQGSHKYLINQTISYIENSGKKDCRDHERDIGNKITQLKRLRTKADYSDSVFDCKESSKSLSLSNSITTILKKY